MILWPEDAPIHKIAEFFFVAACNLKKVIEAKPVCSRFALESEYKTKNEEVKRSTRRDKRSHEKLDKYWRGSICW